MVYRNSGAVPGNILEEIIKRTLGLDMVKIHSDIAQGK
jgi:hypothetical protein